MKLPSFKLEEFWKKYEFSTPYLLCPSDAETWSLSEILDLADLESKKLWDTLRLGYTEVPGLPLLREEIARLYSKLNHEQVLIFAGAEEAIYCAMQTLLKPTDHAIVIKPCYQSLEAVPQAIGAEITAIWLDPKQKWKLNIKDVQNAFRPNTKLLILNYPHNPTGTILDHQTFEAIIRLAREYQCYIFCDEMYRLLEIDEADRLPSIADAYEKGISHFGMTKSFGLAGLRIAWLGCQERNLLESIASYKLYTSICSSALSEVIALMALRAKETILHRNRQIVKKNLGILDQFIERQAPRVSWVRPQSGTIAFLELLLPTPADQFNEQLVQSQGVLIMPGNIFDFPGNFFRIGFGRQNMPQALQLFEQFLDSYENLYERSN
jgi:aspartate/methionine/tyrosine aminotransferase